MTFETCCSECLKNKELVKEFNRLSGCHLGEQKNGIDMAIDKACGYDPNKEAVPAFVNFVMECIWIPMVSSK